MKFLTSLHPASSVCFSFIELFFCLLALKSSENTAGGESTQSYEARFSPPAPPLSGHVPRKRRFAPIRQLLCVLHIFPVISYIFINILSYKNLQPISLRILYLHIIFVFDIFTFDISAFDIFTTQIHFYIIPKNPQMCPAHRDLPTPSHPPSRLNLPHPIPSHTYNGLKTFSLSTTPSGRSPPSAQPFVPSTVAYKHKSTKLPSSTTKHS